MLGPLRILILEDVKFDVELIERELKKAEIDFTSKNVFTREEYIQELEGYNPHLILSDHSMPQFNSVEALQIFKEKKLDIPFILVTGAVSEEFAVKMLKEGADDYILKGNLIRLPSALLAALKQKQSEKERRKAIEELKSSEEHFRSLIENATDIINILDSQLNFTYASPSLERILGYTPSEFIGKNICEYIHPDDFEACDQEFKKELQEDENDYSITYRFRHKNGQWLDIESTGKAYFDEKKSKNFIINSRDITDRKKIEQRLKYKIKELDTLIYMYSHDLKGPFCSLQGFVNIAKMEVKDDVALKYINMFENTTKKLDGILMNLVQITMINRENIKQADVSFDKVIQEALEKFKGMPESKDSNISVKNELKRVFVSDPKLIKMMLENLVHNSLVYKKRDATKLKIEINVTETDAGEALISVKDNGMGIPFEIQEDVYDMFFRGSYESKGSGLGLYIVKNAVEKLKGAIDLHSKFGEGAEFIIKLPELSQNQED
jgi:PAS domain S-box-containing protein